MATRTIPTGVPPDYSDDSRYERINGQWVERPLPTERHAEVQLALTLLLRSQVKDLGGKALQEWSVRRPDSANPMHPDYLTPDVAVALPPIERAPNGYLLPPALLTVEVKSLRQAGLFTKAMQYVEWGIKHVWIVDPDSKECFEYHGGKTFTMAQEELKAANISVRLSDVFDGIEQAYVIPQRGLG